MGCWRGTSSARPGDQYLSVENPVKMHPERITKRRIKPFIDLDYDGVGFPVRGKDFRKIEKENNISLNVFC